MSEGNVKAKVGGGCFCVVLIASAIMLGCSFGVLDPTQIALDHDTVRAQHTCTPLVLATPLPPK
tara:strand:- start:3147 stop:3338 length:192 start_codon:yes stop_codon:yes gene_type:complete